MDQLSLAAALVGYASRSRYVFRGTFIFEGISLSGARVLEIGCGSGAWAIWSALHGASRVVGIEPQFAGSTDGTFAAFRRNVERLRLNELVEAKACSFEDLPLSEGPFDVVIMYNVINHLDEDAVQIVHRDNNALERYVTLLKELWWHIHPAGWVVVADCARDNMWPALGLPSPFARSIEWEKHQNPSTWIEVFQQAGFRSFDLRWSPLYPLPRFTENSWAQYLTCSHFVLRLRAEK